MLSILKLISHNISPCPLLDQWDRVLYVNTDFTFVFCPYFCRIVQMGSWFPAIFEHAGPVFPLNEVFKCFVFIIPSVIQDPFHFIFFLIALLSRQLWIFLPMLGAAWGFAGGGLSCSGLTGMLLLGLFLQSKALSYHVKDQANQESC